MKKSLLIKFMTLIAEARSSEQKDDPMTTTTPTPALAELDLLPCPFCGSSNIDPAEWSGNDGKAGPGCGDCGALGETIEVWNRRAAQPVAPVQDVLTIPTAIMEMPCAVTMSHFPTRHEMAAYKQGHRDARHAAADLVLARADELKALAAQPAEGAGQAAPYHACLSVACSFDHDSVERHAAMSCVRAVQAALAAQPAEVSAGQAGQVANSGCIKCPRDPNKRCDYCGYDFSSYRTERAAAPADLEQQLIERRIGLMPENEGGWHAQVYGDSDTPLARGYGATPSEAVLSAKKGGAEC